MAKKLKLSQTVSVPAKGGDDRLRKKTKVELIAALQKPLHSVLAPRVVVSTGVNTEMPDTEHASTSTVADEQAAKRDVSRMIVSIAGKLKENAKPEVLDETSEHEVLDDNFRARGLG